MNLVFDTLPDTSRVPAGYDAYGRFGITNSGNPFVLREQSSHPSNTEIGGYYAVIYSTKTLVLSPRGASYGFEERMRKMPGLINMIRKQVRM